MRDRADYADRAFARRSVEPVRSSEAWSGRESPPSPPSTGSCRRFLTSPPSSGTTLPISRALSCGGSSFSSVSTCAKRKRIFRASCRNQAPVLECRLRAATARSYILGPELGKTPICSPVAGLVLSNVSPSRRVHPLAVDVFWKLFVPHSATARFYARAAQPAFGRSSSERPGTRWRRRSPQRAFPRTSCRGGVLPHDGR